jgi:hypothetical protein
VTRLWRVAGALGALALIGLVAWRFWLEGDAVRPADRPALPASANDAQAQRPPASIAEATRTVATDIAPACQHQALRLSFVQGVEVACVGPARAVQTGSMRDHVYAAEGSSRWSLRIGAAHGQVIAAVLSDGRRDRYRCSPCSGFSIGATDRYGVRHFEVAAAGLSDGGPSPAIVHVAATLRIEPQAPRACASVPLEVAEAGGTSTSFCPDGGAGFELGDDGRYRYRFDDLDGHTVSVTLDDGGGVREAQFGALTCTGAACIGLASRGGASADERSFDFAGVRLLDRGGVLAATLTGRLVMPAQR